MDVISSLKWRYAVKKFDNAKKINANTLHVIEDALILTASSYGLQPWKFLIVQNEDIRKKLTSASWNQSQIEDCSHLIVFLAKKNIDEKYVNDYIYSIAKTRNIDVKLLDEYKAMMLGGIVNGMDAEKQKIWAQKQCYIALGNLLNTCAILSVDACPMEGFNAVKYDEILNLTDSGYTSTVVCPIGFRSTKDDYQNLQKVRFNKSELIDVMM